MYDSTSPFDIPIGVDMVAGYVDGAYAWPSAGWERHANSRQVRITVFGQTLDAEVADIESGTMTVQEGVDWARRKILQGDKPALYFSVSLYGAVQAEINRIGILASEWTVWAADWTTVPHILPGTYATQYISPSVGSPGHYDISLVADYWPGVDPAPVTGGGVTPPPGGGPTGGGQPPPGGGPTGGAPPAPSGFSLVTQAWANLSGLIDQNLLDWTSELVVIQNSVDKIG